MHLHYKIIKDSSGGFSLIRELRNNKDLIYPVIRIDYLSFDADDINSLLWIAKNRYGISHLNIQIKI